MGQSSPSSPHMQTGPTGPAPKLDDDANPSSNHETDMHADSHCGSCADENSMPQPPQREPHTRLHKGIRQPKNILMVLYAMV
jgi:hypothetical protein